VQIRKQKEEGIIDSDLLYSLAKGPDPRARVFNRCFINDFLFRTASIEKNLITRNSGVYVKGDPMSHLVLRNKTRLAIFVPRKSTHTTTERNSVRNNAI